MSGALLLLETSVRPLPPVPTRDQVCAVQMSFQGLTVDLVAEASTPWVTPGPIPWFEAALCCLGPQNRAIVYEAKKSAGDTHALVYFTSGQLLYDEANQPYQAYQCANYNANPGAYTALLVECLENGFIPCTFLWEQQYPGSSQQLPVCAAAIASYPGANLFAYTSICPGFDGIFYGWAPVDITAWAAQARSLGFEYAMIEFNTGHIPLGNGPSDYAPGGAMTGFDCILAEFDNWPTLGDAEFQIIGRMIGPAYVRPPQQPSGDDPHPPWYLATPSPRGPYYFIAFEYATYQWTRSQISATACAQGRAWYQATGCTHVC